MRPRAGRRPRRRRGGDPGLQPRAPIHRTAESDADPEVVLAGDSFDFDAARRAPGWRRALAAGRDGDDAAGAAASGDHGGRGHAHDHGDVPAAVAHGVESVVYERERPFDPERFAAWLADWDGRVVRAKGFAHVASRPDTVMGLSQAGPVVRFGPLGEWGDDEPRTRLVFIGRGVDDGSVEAALDDCLAARGIRRRARTRTPTRSPSSGDSTASEAHSTSSRRSSHSSWKPYVAVLPPPVARRYTSSYRRRVVQPSWKL
ncbi:CobW family GTP-binding protein [Halobaculum litoreum]|uniref:CobW family GTP-binding protein n=1 Tax=Halobaculum litoreum TaxID=3031998 RepID=A0ABD5XP02_9EURY